MRHLIFYEFMNTFGGDTRRGFYCNLFVVCISFVSVGFCRILHATVAAASSALSHQFYAFRAVARAHTTQAKHTGASIKHLMHSDDMVKREQWLINTKFIYQRVGENR